MVFAVSQAHRAVHQMSTHHRIWRQDLFVGSDKKSSPLLSETVHGSVVLGSGIGPREIGVATYNFMVTTLGEKW